MQWSKHGLTHILSHTEDGSTSIYGRVDESDGAFTWSANGLSGYGDTMMEAKLAVLDANGLLMNRLDLSDEEAKSLWAKPRISIHRPSSDCDNFQAGNVFMVGERWACLSCLCSIAEIYYAATRTVRQMRVPPNGQIGHTTRMRPASSMPAWASQHSAKIVGRVIEGPQCLLTIEKTRKKEIWE